MGKLETKIVLPFLLMGSMTVALHANPNQDQGKNIPKEQIIEKKEKADMSELRPVIVIETTEGVIEITLKPSVAPKACENFMKLADKKYYDGVSFHRVIKKFMIQGGDPKGNGTGGESIWGKPFEDEFSNSVAFDKPGLLAMANSGPHSNGSQFFITTAETPWLNKRHTIFGEVTKGYDVVQKIEATETDRMDRPKKPQKILKMYVKKAQ
jgi:peptidylprolyl isomerase